MVLLTECSSPCNDTVEMTRHADIRVKRGSILREHIHSDNVAPSPYILKKGIINHNIAAWFNMLECVTFLKVALLDSALRLRGSYETQNNCSWRRKQIQQKRT